MVLRGRDGARRHAEVIDKARKRSMRVARFEDELDELRAHCVVGSVDQAIERLSEYAAAGVERIVLNHEVFDGLEMLDVLAEQVFPKVEAEPRAGEVVSFP